jgi:predicted permease
MNDLNFAFRQLRKNPGFAAVALLTLALALGANLTVFAVIDSVLLRPLPFPEPGRLVTIFNSYPKAGLRRDGASLTSYYERRGNIPALPQMSAFRYNSAIVGEAGSTERMDVLRVTPEFFRVLGAGLAIGRAFTEDEMTPEAGEVVVLADPYWRRRFNADPHVIGQVLRVDGMAKTIVGVLPHNFQFLSSKAQVFLPLSSRPEERGVNSRHVSGTETIARLKPGATVAEAQAQLDAHYAAHAAEFPWAKQIAETGFQLTVAPLQADHVAAVRPTLLLVQTGALLLLLIGGVNLVNLLLIRASGRAKELAVRQSLGASRRHIVKHTIVETVLLALTGGLAGLAVASGGIRFLSLVEVDHLPLGARIAFNGRLAWFALVEALVMGMVIALPVAWFNLRGHLAGALQSESRGGTASHSVQRLRHSFIVAQIALAFVLLAGAGLLGVSLRRAMLVSPGFRPDHVLTGRLSLPSNSYPDDEARLAFTDRLLEEAGTQPGVAAAGVITDVPVNGSHEFNVMTVVGHTPDPGAPPILHHRYGVAGDYFMAMGIPLRAGRFLEGADSHRESRACVVDENFARRYWPRGGALGQRVFEGPPQGRKPDEAFTVVGLVGAVKQSGLTDQEANGAIYFPYRFNANNTVYVAARTSLPPESLGLALQKAVRRIDPDLPLDDLRSMDVRIADSLIARRSPALLIGIFATAALLLAAIGTYGVLAYAVSQRRREIGVRMALGALPGQIGWQFLALGLRLLACGTVLGVLGAWLAGRAMQSVLFATPALPLATVAGAAAVLAAVSLAACLLPTLRASRVDPMEALRSE